MSDDKSVTNTWPGPERGDPNTVRSSVGGGARMRRSEPGDRHAHRVIDSRPVTTSRTAGAPGSGDRSIAGSPRWSANEPAAGRCRTHRRSGPGDPVGSLVLVPSGAGQSCDGV